MKKTLLTIIAALLLGGVVNAQDWGETDSHAKSSNTPIVASVTLDGNAVTPTADYRLGAFVGEELRGLAAPHTDNNFWIQVFYNQGTTETISFKLYDGTNEYTTCSVTKATQEEGWGTPSEPVVLDFATTQTMTQTTAMTSGWNWWSSFIEITNGAEALTMLENSLGTSGSRIQSSNDGRVDYYTYNGGIWYGQLESICNEQMYKVRTSAQLTSEFSGTSAVPSDHPITINNNWNWIGFPCNHEVSVEVAMSAFTPNHLDQIKSLNNGYTTYYNTGSVSMWYGTLNTLIPGEGYMYKSTSTESKTLTFQTGRGETVAENITPQGNVFLPEETSFSDNMTVTAVVDLEGNELRNSEYEVAVFVGNECRGSVKMMYVEPLDRYFAFLLIAGDEEQTMRFVLTDGKETSWSNDYLMYSSDATIGNLAEPTVLHFGPLGVNDNNDQYVNVFPNPTNGIFNIEGNNIRKVEIINAYGQIVYSKEIKAENIQLDLSNYSIGTYMLRVVTDNGISTKQIIKK